MESKEQIEQQHNAGTHVVQDEIKSRRARVFLRLALAASVLILGCSRFVIPPRLVSEYCISRQMAVDTDKVVTTYSQRDPSTLVEVSSLKASDRTEFADWLENHGKDPVEYAVETAAKHEITIFGEYHWRRDILDFFNKMVPDLYHKAGVTCIALETCIPQENANIAKLVTAEKFDKELALEIARRCDAWKAWGAKGYWDIFETVWRLNKDLPEGKKKMRVVGIGLEFDGPSWSMARLKKDSLPGSEWNKLRIFTLIDDLVRMSMNERLYAANVARETIEKGERGVVLVGFAHSSINQLWPHGTDDKLYSERARMGFMLHEKYGDQVSQIVFHPALYNNKPTIRFIEKVASKQNHRPFGFEVEGSPFETLRAGSTNQARLQRGLCLSDLAAGYIYLKPKSEMKQCEWTDGYIDERLFKKYKGYYKKYLGVKQLNSAEETDKALSKHPWGSL